MKRVQGIYQAALIKDTLTNAGLLAGSSGVKIFSFQGFGVDKLEADHYSFFLFCLR